MQHRREDVGSTAGVSARWRSLLAAIVVLASVFVVAGCGGSTTAVGGDSSSTSSSGNSGGSKGGDFTVGLVSDQGGLNDRSFNTLANLGVEKAKSDLGVKAQVLESKSSSDYEPNLGQLVQAKSDLVIAVGFLMSEPVKAVAAKAPGTNFAILDFSYGDAPIKNVRGLVFKEQEAGYLAGYLAGLVEHDGKLKNLNGAKMVSSIGGQKIPPVDHYIAGYEAGVKAACPECKVVHAYSQDFVAQDKCKELALNQIAQGSDIVFQVAGGCGLGALDAVKSKGVWGIGVDADQAYLGSHVLTSAVKRVDVAVFDTIKQAKDGSFQGGGDSIYGIKENGVGLGKISPAAESYAPRIKAVQQEIIDGKLTIPDTVK